MLLCGCTQGKRRPFKTSNPNTPILNIVGQERHFFLTKFLPLVSQDNGHIFLASICNRTTEFSPLLVTFLLHTYIIIYPFCFAIEESYLQLCKIFSICSSLEMELHVL